MEIVDKICTLILFVIGALGCYKALYFVIGLFCKAKTYPVTDVKKRYGIIVCARNEEKVIGNLIESIKKQTYDENLITTFIVADNCTDKTAEICRNLGANVYERFDETKKRKGWALEWFFEKLVQEDKLKDYDNFLIFDADNLLSPTFVEEINKTFVVGNDIVIGYKNVKNFGTNFISSAYGFHQYRSNFFSHRPRNLLNLSCNITGCGFGFSREIVEENNGWHYFGLTEDAEMSMKELSKGKSIAYCEAAEFFDEQPYEFKVVFKQRLRWARGRLDGFFKYGGSLLKGAFTLKDFKKRFSCWDHFLNFLPYNLISFVLSSIYPVISFIYSLINKTYSLSNMLFNVLTLLLSSYFTAIVNGIIIAIRERKKIHCSTSKIAFYILTWFWFDLIGLPLTLLSIFMKVEWKTIKHDDPTKIDDLLNDEYAKKELNLKSKEENFER